VPLVTVCSECGCKISTPDSLAGKKLRCPQCDAEVRAPELHDEKPPELVEAIRSDLPSPVIGAGPQADGDDERPPARSRREPERDGLPRRKPARHERDEDDGLAGIIPYRNGKALAAYYTGVFSLIPGLGLLLGPAALVLGILGQKYANANPKAKGLGHAVAGIVLGALTSLANWATLVIVLIIWSTSDAREREEERTAAERREAIAARIKKEGLPEARLPPGFDPKGAPLLNPAPPVELNEPLFSKNRDLLDPERALDVPAEDGLVAAVRVSSDHVSKILFAPDGKSVALVAAESSRVVDVASSRVRETPAQEPLAYSPDSTSLAVAITTDTGFVLSLEDAKTGLFPRQFRHFDRSTCRAAAFSPDGRAFAMMLLQRGRSVLLLSKVNALQDEPRTLATSGELTTAPPVFSPDSATIAFATGRPKDGVGIQLVDVKSAASTAWLGGHSKGASIHSLAFSPDGTSLASAGSDNTIRIWDLKEKKERKTLKGHQQAVGKVLFSPDGTILASRGFDGAIRLWDANSGKQLAVRDKEEGPTCDAMAFSPDGRLLVTGSKRLLKAWDVAKLIGK
jgi:WD40 repeat protein